VLITKKERNLILFVALAFFVGGIWFVVKKYVLGYEPLTFEKKSEDNPEYAQYAPETEEKKKPKMSSETIQKSTSNSVSEVIKAQEPTLQSPEAPQKKKETSITPEPAIKKVNINKANLEELVALPYIGESKAREIVKYREANGLFKKKKDLVAVSGIGEATLKKLEKYIEL
jgi:comEA protein